MEIDQVDKNRLLLHWESELRIVCRGHYQTADRFDMWNIWIGIFSIVSSTVSGSSAWINYIYHEANNELSHLSVVVTVIAALLAAISTSLQTFLKFPEKAELSRSAAMRYASLLRKLEQRRILSFENCSNHEDWCTKFLSEWEEISRDNQSVPSVLWNKLANKYMILLDEKDYCSHNIISGENKTKLCSKIRNMFDNREN
jgi:hypothetical protein